MLKIAIAIGHNFAHGDRGASGNGVTEADTTKVIIDKIAGMKFQKIEFTKVPENLDIDQRVSWVNKGGFDAFIELHLDSAVPKKGDITSTATGSTVFFVGGNEWAEDQAIKMAEAYSKYTGLKNRGAKADTSTSHKRLGVIRDIKIFGVLMELGFISNSQDLETIQEKGLQGILQSIYAVWPEYKEEKKNFWNGKDGTAIADDKSIALMVTRVIKNDPSINTTGIITRQEVADFLEKRVHN